MWQLASLDGARLRAILAPREIWAAAGARVGVKALAVFDFNLGIR